MQVAPRPLGALALQFLAALAREGAAQRTLDTYATALRSIERTAGAHAVASPSGADFGAIAASGMSQRTRRLWVTVLRSLHRWAKGAGMPYAAAALDAPLPAMPERSPRPFAADEIERVRRAAWSMAENEPEWGAYFALLDGCGMRTNEPLRLSWSDVSHALRPKRDARLQLLLRGSKAGARIVPLWDIVARGRIGAALVVPALKRWRFLSSASDAGAPIFDRSTSWVKVHWRSTALRAGISATAPAGQLRHTFACEELTRSGDLVRVAAWLGHASLDTTLYYARLLDLPTRPAI